MIVVDTQILVYYFLPTDKSELAEQVFLSDPEWYTSALWRYEFRNVLAGFMRKRILDADSALRIAEEAELMMLYRADNVPLARVTGLIQKSPCTAYDLEFVGVALSRNIPLVTEDLQVLEEFPETAVTMRQFLGDRKPK